MRVNGEGVGEFLRSPCLMSVGAPQQRFFRQPSAGELEGREYQQALTAIFNHRPHQAEEEAAIRQRQQAEAAR